MSYLEYSSDLLTDKDVKLALVVLPLMAPENQLEYAERIGEAWNIDFVSIVNNLLNIDLGYMARMRSESQKREEDKMKKKEYCIDDMSELELLYGIPDNCVSVTYKSNLGEAPGDVDMRPVPSEEAGRIGEAEALAFLESLENMEVEAEDSESSGSMDLEFVPSPTHDDAAGTSAEVEPSSAEIAATTSVSRADPEAKGTGLVTQFTGARELDALSKLKRISRKRLWATMFTHPIGKLDAQGKTVATLEAPLEGRSGDEYLRFKRQRLDNENVYSTVYEGIHISMYQSRSLLISRARGVKFKLGSTFFDVQADEERAAEIIQVVKRSFSFSQFSFRD